jgi:hypothetical protein
MHIVIEFKLILKISHILILLILFIWKYIWIRVESYILFHALIFERAFLFCTHLTIIFLIIIIYSLLRISELNILLVNLLVVKCLLISVIIIYLGIISI